LIAQGGIHIHIGWRSAPQPVSEEGEFLWESAAADRNSNSVELITLRALIHAAREK
jgi:hypothetical protein